MAFKIGKIRTNFTDGSSKSRGSVFATGEHVKFGRILIEQLHCPTRVPKLDLRSAHSDVNNDKRPSFVTKTNMSSKLCSTYKPVEHASSFLEIYARL